MISYTFWLDRLTGKRYQLTWYRDLVTGLETCTDIRLA